MSDYVTGSQIADFAQEFDALSQNGQDLIATSASRLFDNLCDVDPGFFAASSGEYFKTFYGDGTAYLRLLPYTGVIATGQIVILDNDDIEQEIPEYFEQNGYLVIKGYGQGVPTRDVMNAGPSFFTSSWSPWNTQNPAWNTSASATFFAGWPLNLEITVSAAWGFPTIPADVQQATIQLAIHLWRIGDPAFAAVSQSGHAFTQHAVPTAVQIMADNYRKRYKQYAGFG